MELGREGVLVWEAIVWNGAGEVVVRISLHCGQGFVWNAVCVL